MSPDRAFNFLEKIAIDVTPSGAARVAAIVVRKKEIVSIGTNSPKSHPFQSRFQRNPDAIYFHAENAAIQRAETRIGAKELANCTLFVCRMKYLESHKTVMVRGIARPCDGCMKAIAAYKIKRVCYTCDDGSFEKI